MINWADRLASRRLALRAHHQHQRMLRALIGALASRFRTLLRACARVCLLTYRARVHGAGMFARYGQQRSLRRSGAQTVLAAAGIRASRQHNAALSGSADAQRARCGIARVDIAPYGWGASKMLKA